MAHCCTVRGQSAELRWGYYSAAAIGPWTLTVHPSGGALTGTVIRADAFRTSQPSLTFRVTRQNAPAWIWPVLTLQIADGSLTATLGPQE